MNISLKDNLMKENDLSPGGLNTWSGVGEMGGGGREVLSPSTYADSMCISTYIKAGVSQD